MFAELQKTLSTRRLFLERRSRDWAPPETIVPSAPIVGSGFAQEPPDEEPTLRKLTATFGIDGAAEFIAAGIRATTSTGR